MIANTVATSERMIDQKVYQKLRTLTLTLTLALTLALTLGDQDREGPRNSLQKFQ